MIKFPFFDCNCMNGRCDIPRLGKTLGELKQSVKGWE